ncbi:LacI family transcriptional regulator [Litoreibacter ponti]|uniref:LacI family transcriptional regulator n=1 Tax=Litoreibacter ponti TaxID=1510457 RepID=A0A2T6BDR9_9RHOB|nr:substrate-binding domain-containing protein [Litoreibacter ponti]PTX54205.1 LacI family transcriptional regulator [Litoreibacter ponti]
MSLAGTEKLRQAPRRVTISDVSDALGLTKSTVSRALNDYPDISDSTRLRVRRMADKMGYRPLSQAQAIRTGLTKSLGLVIQLGDHDAQRPFLAEFLAGLSSGASAEGWTLTLAATESPAQTEETFRQMIRDQKVDGFVLPRTLTRDPRVALLRAAGVPFVMFGRTGKDAGCAWFDILGEDAMADAVTRLAALGHRRIGFINGGMQYNYAPLREAGFRRGMADAGLEIDPALMRADAVTRAAGAQAAREMLDLTDPPTAIVCAVDMAALGVYRAAEERGLAVGADLSVMAYDGSPDGAHATPPLSTYAVDYKTAGQRLSALLIRRIKGAAPEELRETALPILMDRGSVGPPR